MAAARRAAVITFRKLTIQITLVSPQHLRRAATILSANGDATSTGEQSSACPSSERELILEWYLKVGKRSSDRQANSL